MCGAICAQYERMGVRGVLMWLRADEVVNPGGVGSVRNRNFSKNRALWIILISRFF